MYVTAKTEKGKKFFEKTVIYMPQATNSKQKRMLYGAQYKTGYIRDTSLLPFKPRIEKIEIRLPKGVRTVDVEVALSYRPVPRTIMPIKKVTKRVSLEQ
jgi:hypothetical protein